MEEFIQIEDVEQTTNSIIENYVRIEDTKLMNNITKMLYTIGDIRLAIANTEQISVSMVDYINRKAIHCRNELKDIATLLKEEQKRTK